VKILLWITEETFCSPVMGPDFTQNVFIYYSHQCCLQLNSYTNVMTC
jgi:hypothetical protein